MWKTLLLLLLAIPMPSLAQDQPVKLGSGMYPARRVKNAPVVYPADARHARVEGTVTLRAIIDRDGRIVQLTPLSGPGMLKDAAKEAVSKWEYEPYLVNGSAAKVQTLFSVNFAFTNDALAPVQGVVVAPTVMAGLLKTVVDPTTMPAAKGKKGIVRLRINVDNTGSVVHADALEGSQELVKIAGQAVSQWKYSPYVSGGNTVEVQTTVAFDFDR